MLGIAILYGGIEMNIKIKCEGCRNQISPELYEENDGLCSKCKTRVYPADCFDPRKDMRAWWTAPQVVNRAPENIRPVKYGFARGRLAAE